MHLIRKILAVVLLAAVILVVGAGNIIAFLQQKGTETVDEVKRFLDCIGGRATSYLLVETPEAAQNIDDILALDPEKGEK